MARIKAFICGCAGTSLADDEKDFLRRERPWGIILFRRNIDRPEQVEALVRDFKKCVERDDATILVDQEGGRVQRLGPPHWPAYPSAAHLGQIAGGLAAQADAVRLTARLMAEDLADLGINVDCMPVLDTPSVEAHAVIGDRAYGLDPTKIAMLGQAAVDGLLSGRVLPVVKHAPGHGRARADSHLELPVVRASLEELDRVDFVPFKALARAPLAMTAHVLYEAIDPRLPATLSPTIVQSLIRDKIGFSGLLMTDDLSMKALTGSLDERASAAFRAGVDVALHCNGDLKEAAAVATATPALEGPSLDRAQRALALVAGKREPFDRAAGLARLRALLDAGPQNA
jgi:beta-N-acetylhexosaminidase